MPQKKSMRVSSSHLIDSRGRTPAATAREAAPTVDITYFDALHRILLSHIRRGNHLGVMMLLALPEVHANPLFWRTCTYPTGLVAAVLSAAASVPLQDGASQPGERSKATSATVSGEPILRLALPPARSLPARTESSDSPSRSSSGADHGPLSLPELYLLLRWSLKQRRTLQQLKAAREKADAHGGREAASGVDEAPDYLFPPSSESRQGGGGVLGDDGNDAADLAPSSGREGKSHAGSADADEASGVGLGEDGGGGAKPVADPFHGGHQAVSSQQNHRKRRRESIVDATGNHHHNTMLLEKEYWDSTAEAADLAVDVTLRRLLAKIEEPTKEEIQAVCRAHGEEITAVLGESQPYQPAAPTVAATDEEEEEDCIHLDKLCQLLHSHCQFIEYANPFLSHDRVFLPIGEEESQPPHQQQGVAANADGSQSATAATASGESVSLIENPLIPSPNDVGDAATLAPDTQTPTPTLSSASTLPFAQRPLVSPSPAVASAGPRATQVSPPHLGSMTVTNSDMDGQRGVGRASNSLALLRAMRPRPGSRCVVASNFDAVTVGATPKDSDEPPQRRQASEGEQGGAQGAQDDDRDTDTNDSEDAETVPTPPLTGEEGESSATASSPLPLAQPQRLQQPKAREASVSSAIAAFDDFNRQEEVRALCPEYAGGGRTGPQDGSPQSATVTGTTARTSTTTIPGAGPQRQRRVRFTAQEDEAIIRGVGQYGQRSGAFPYIYKAFLGVWRPNRTPTHLYDHWRDALKKRALHRLPQELGLGSSSHGNKRGDVERDGSQAGVTGTPALTDEQQRTRMERFSLLPPSLRLGSPGAAPINTNTAAPSTRTDVSTLRSLPRGIRRTTALIPPTNNATATTPSASAAKGSESPASEIEEESE